MKDTNKHRSTEGREQKKKAPGVSAPPSPKKKKAPAAEGRQRKAQAVSGRGGSPRTETPTPKRGGSTEPSRTPAVLRKRGEGLSHTMKAAKTEPRGGAGSPLPRRTSADKGIKLRIIPLGGLQEIGKNMTVIEYGEDILVIDCGMAFPDGDMPGVDYVIPDITYLTRNAARVRGILITHGHEDHVGAIAHVLAALPVPVYGTKLSLGILQGRLQENPPKKKPVLCTVEAGDVVALGRLRAEFIHVNHSIADACAIAVHTPIGTVLHTGDFKLDVSPIDGQMMDLARLGELGRHGVEVLLCESTNAERAGFTPSERTVGGSLDRIFHEYADRRIIVATFSSNVHRVQQIINASHKHGRKVAVLGRSMVNVIGAATELGYMDFPDGVLIDAEDVRSYPPEQVTLITTGSQGEPMSALYRIAFAERSPIKLSSRDVVVFSSSAIPGNEKTVGNVINALIKNGVKVVSDAAYGVHVSGHACREEIKLMIALTRPKYFMPIHGEYRHLYANKDIAEFMGIAADHIFVSELGRVLEVDRKGAAFAGSVPAGQVLVDGSGVGDIGSVVLRDRKLLSEDGLLVVVATVDLHAHLLLSGPEIVTRGFVYVKESEELLERTRRLAAEVLENTMKRGVTDFGTLKTELREALAKFISQSTKRKPMILPVLMDM